MENLVGELVIVHPGLKVDPADQQGKVGTIISADLEMDHIYVSFGTDQTWMYSADELLTLKPNQEVYQQVLQGVQTLKKEDYKTLLRVSLFQDNNTPEHIAKAYDLIAKNHSALYHATMSLQDRIDLSIGRDQGMEIGTSPTDNTQTLLKLNPFNYNYMNKAEINQEKLPMLELEKYGLAKDGQILIDARDVQALLEGRRSDVIRILNVSSDGKQLKEVDAKVSLNETEDGKVELKFHPLYKEATYPDFLTDLEAEKLQNGETVNITKRITDDEGLLKEILVEFDEVNNEFVVTDAEKIVAPDMINAEYLSEQQRSAYRNGKTVELSDGTKFRYSGIDRLGLKANKVALIASILIDGGISYILYKGISSLAKGEKQGSEQEAYTDGYLRAYEDFKGQQAEKEQKMNSLSISYEPSVSHGYTRQGITR
ncbi:DUF4099 domain-containing protein [Pedobacter sp. MC2016-24]|uniref:DUF4099 domain-containing protein n=1 Tax=Pedobacter sp. MC2016-24 TaxID=2780090 RepID=UPI0018822A86|nr:DUF4099 domain-containing protein [Pedobacter sp. MC2016-24]MBE9599909.1 DUF4099 domain-containing protein [Pedobacter sp. MC2016-24]